MAGRGHRGRVALVVVVVASVTMERAASALGQRYAVPQIVTGGLVLAAVTSLPNAVAAVYLAGPRPRRRDLEHRAQQQHPQRGRRAAAARRADRARPGHRPRPGWSPRGTSASPWLCSRSPGGTAAWAAAAGLLVIAAYAVFAASVLASGYALAGIPALVMALGISTAVLLAAALAPSPKSRQDRPQNSLAVPGAQPGRGARGVR